MNEKRYIYTGGLFPDPRLDPVCYNPGFFQLEIGLESDVLYELRRENGLEPARMSESTPEELADIEAFFIMNKDTFRFLFDPKGDLIGSVLSIGNYIQSLCISRAYQGHGYGEKLTQYCINKILMGGHTSVELLVLPGNDRAENLYGKLGFVEIQK